MTFNSKVKAPSITVLASQQQILQHICMHIPRRSLYSVMHMIVMFIR